MSGWLAWRLVKLLALALWSAGVLGAVCVPAPRSRLVLVRCFATPGFVLLWGAGWMMARLTDRSLGTPWIAATLVLSLTALHAAFLASHGRGRSRLTAAPALAFGGLLGSVGLMVLRPVALPHLAAVIGAAGLLGLLLSWPWRHRVAPSAAEAAAVQDEVLRGFRWLAWAEGASLLVMVGVSMPLRMLLGVSLDGGTGLIGWVHGALVLVFLQSLLSTGRRLGWPGSWALAGALSSLLPGGSFLFVWLSQEHEAWVRPAR